MVAQVQLFSIAIVDLPRSIDFSVDLGGHVGGGTSFKLSFSGAHRVNFFLGDALEVDPTFSTVVAPLGVL